MAKRPQRRLSRNERDQAGCIWGFISIFDLRHGRTTKRLLADRRRMGKQSTSAGHSSNQTNVPDPIEECENVVVDEETKMLEADPAKTSVKELMEEEMVNEQGPKNQPNDSEPEKINSKYMKRHQKKKSRSCSGDVDFSELECLILENNNGVSEQKPSNKYDLETLMKVLAQINQKNTKHDSQGDLDMPSDSAVEEKKLLGAVKLFIEQRLGNSKRFDEDCSKELMDALQTLSSNKGLFLKVLNDPNSELVNHIQDLGKDQTPSPNLSKEKPVNSKSDEVSGRKNRNFFRRRSKSLESFHLGGVKDCQSPNKIVILKPGPTTVQSPETESEYMDNKAHNEKNNTSQFSFTEIKRKLRHAMGKERHGISPDRLIVKVPNKPQNWNNGDKSGESFAWRSPNRNHFYTERFAVSSPSFKKGEPVDRLKDSVVNEVGQYPRVGGSNIYVEAKKHLSEMLKNGDENPESTTGQLSKSLGRILSLPEYNGSPCWSPRKYGDDIFMTAQMRLSPLGVVKNNAGGLLLENHNSHSSPRRENLELRSPDMNGNIPHGDDDQKCSLEVQSFKQDTIVREVAENEEMTESRPQQEEDIMKRSSESSSNSVEAREQDGDESYSQFLKELSPCFNSELFGEEDQILSSPTASSSDRPLSGEEVENSDCAIDKMERPSPISVLEPLFTDDDISPASTISRPVEKEIQPRQIHFEEQSNNQGICMRISAEDEESAFEYVEAVLLGSGLNWDEFLLRWLSFYEILDPSLFEEVELFSSRPHHDQKLLFDCANDALNEVCESYFGCLSHGKPNIRPVPKGMDLIREIWEVVERYLFQHPQPHCLDQLVRRDLESSRKWMNLQSDVELIGFEMGETIFEELVEDTVLSFLAADNISLCEFSVLSAGNDDTL